MLALFLVETSNPFMHTRALMKARARSKPPCFLSVSLISSSFVSMQEMGKKDSSVYTINEVTVHPSFPSVREHSWGRNDRIFFFFFFGKRRRFSRCRICLRELCSARSSCTKRLNPELLSLSRRALIHQ